MAICTVALNLIFLPQGMTLRASIRMYCACAKYLLPWQYQASPTRLFTNYLSSYLLVQCCLWRVIPQHSAAWSLSCSLVQTWARQKRVRVQASYICSWSLPPSQKCLNWRPLGQKERLWQTSGSANDLKVRQSCWALERQPRPVQF